MSRPGLESSKPFALALQRRRWTALFSLPFAIVLAVNGVSSVLWLPKILGERPGWIVGALFVVVSLAFAGSIGRSAWKALTEPGPALLLDARGITDRFHLNAHVPWSDIQSASLDHGDGDALVLVLRAGAVLPGGDVVRGGLRRGVVRAFDGGDLTIPLGGLVYQPRRLREALDGHLARARAGGVRRP